MVFPIVTNGMIVRVVPFTVCNNTFAGGIGLSFLSTVTVIGRLGKLFWINHYVPIIIIELHGSCKFSEDGPSLNLTDSQFLLVSLSFKIAEDCNTMIPATFCEKIEWFSWSNQYHGDIMMHLGDIINTVWETSFVIWVPPWYWTPPTVLHLPHVSYILWYSNHKGWCPPWYCTPPQYQTHIQVENVSIHICMCQVVSLNCKTFLAVGIHL